MALDMLSAFNEATKEADAFENHPISALNLEDKMLYLQGLGMVMNADGEIHETEKEYCRILVKSFGMDVSVLDDVISFVQAPDSETIQAFVRCYRRNPLAQVFLFDALMMTRRDGKVHDKEMPLVNAIANQLEILKGTQQDIFDLFCHIKNRNWQESGLYFSSHLLNPEHFKHLLAYYDINLAVLMDEVKNIVKNRLLENIEEKIGFSITQDILKPQNRIAKKIEGGSIFSALAERYEFTEKEVMAINRQRKAARLALLSPDIIMPYIQRQLNRKELRVRGETVFKEIDKEETYYCNLNDLGLAYNKENVSISVKADDLPKLTPKQIPKILLQDFINFIF